MKIREKNSLVKKLWIGWWPLGWGIPGTAVCVPCSGTSPTGPNTKAWQGSWSSSHMETSKTMTLLSKCGLCEVTGTIRRFPKQKRPPCRAEAIQFEKTWRAQIGAHCYLVAACGPETWLYQSGYSQERGTTRIYTLRDRWQGTGLCSGSESAGYRGPGPSKVCSTGHWGGQAGTLPNCSCYPGVGLFLLQVGFSSGWVRPTKMI